MATIRASRNAASGAATERITARRLALPNIVAKVMSMICAITASTTAMSRIPKRTASNTYAFFALRRTAQTIKLRMTTIIAMKAVRLTNRLSPMWLYQMSAPAIAEPG